MSARVALLAMLLAMGAALLVTAAASRRAVSRAGTTLARGQAELFVETVRREQHDRRGPLDDADLSSLLAEKEPEGLRFVAQLDHDGRLLASAGTELGGEPYRKGPGLSIERIGPRLRVLAGPPRPRGEEPRRALARPFPPPPRRDGRPPRRGAREAPPPRRAAGRPELSSHGADEPPPPPQPERIELVLEFEPLLATELERQATRTLALGALAAAALGLAAVGSWRLLSLRERDERRLAEQHRLASLGEMSAVLAHEIRNPLASLKGHAQLLAEKLPVGGAERRGAERVVAESRRLETLATRLLDFVRTARVEVEDCSPAALLRDCVAEVGEGRVDVDDAQAPAVWRLDPLRVRQVLRNLLENALQASTEGLRVEARCALVGGRLAFDVRDRGEGLPPGDPARLFEPFHTSRASGTGLGLAVAKRVVELHGGRITARNHPEGGARFRVELPRGGEEA